MSAHFSLSSAVSQHIIYGSTCLRVTIFSSHRTSTTPVDLALCSSLPRDILCPVPMPSFLFGSAVNVCCDLGYFYLSTYPDCLWLTPSHVLHLLFLFPSIVCP